VDFRGWGRVLGRRGRAAGGDQGLQKHGKIENGFRSKDRERRKIGAISILDRRPRSSWTQQAILKQRRKNDSEKGCAKAAVIKRL
jgi:hypothetical protein